MKEVCISTKDFLNMAKDFSAKKMEYVAVSMSSKRSGETVVTFNATKDDIDYVINYDFEAK